MNISGPAAVAKPEMLFYAPGDLTVTGERSRPGVSPFISALTVSKQGIHSAFQRTQKIRTLLLLEKSSDFVVVVHLQGLEPWAH